MIKLEIIITEKHPYSASKKEDRRNKGGLCKQTKFIIQRTMKGTFYIKTSNINIWQKDFPLKINKFIMYLKQCVFEILLHYSSRAIVPIGMTWNSWLLLSVRRSIKVPDVVGTAKKKKNNHKKFFFYVDNPFWSWKTRFNSLNYWDDRSN